MSTLSRFAQAVGRMFGGTSAQAPTSTATRPAPAPRTKGTAPRGPVAPPPADTSPKGAAPSPKGAAPSPKGAAPSPKGAATSPRPSSFVTVQVDPSVAAGVGLSYTPHPDDRPDPGEVVWAWVPYEENDGRGKDRPVLVLARLSAASVLAIQLTSKSHEGDSGSLSLGTGAWDHDGRASWARLDRLFRVYDVSMRREGAALDRSVYTRVASALKSRYRW